MKQIRHKTVRALSLASFFVTLLASSPAVSGGEFDWPAADPVLHETYSSLIAEAVASGRTVPRVQVHRVTFPLPARLKQVPRAAVALGNAEGFVLELAPSAASIYATDAAGELQGLNTLLRYLAENSPLSARFVADHPVLRVRALHLDLLDLPPAKAEALLAQAHLARFNTLILQVSDRISLQGSEKLAVPQAWPTAAFSEFVAKARLLGFNVVPEVKLLTHQEKFFKQAYPRLMFNTVTYDPRKPEVYSEVVFPYLEELLRVVRPSAVLIGHDEVAGWNVASRKKWLSTAESMLPAELFLQDISKLEEFLSARGVETWMWGDMFIPADAFPRMLARHLHGTDDYMALLPRIPKSVVLCDWHYFDTGPDYPSLAYFIASGHDVLGATWKTPLATLNFSRYAAGRGERVRGMIATTWYHVQWREWDIVESIIRRSGDIFWAAGAEQMSGEGG